ATLAIAISSRSVRQRVRMLVVLAGAFVLLVSANFVPAIQSDQGVTTLALLTARAQYTAVQLLDPQNQFQQRRQVESLSIFQTLTKEQLDVHSLIGFGLGATYVGPTGSSLDTLVIGPRHFIHDGYLAIWFRLGLIGLLAY